MPTPEKTSLDAIVLAASEILEADGLAGVTMQAVAQRVGVRAPSLYKRVPSREALIQLVAEDALTDLAGRLNTTTSAGQLANGLRAFGKERPAVFQLVMGPQPGSPSLRNEVVLEASAAILRTATDLAGEEYALEAARTMTAWATGFISMELNGGFNLGGDVDRAWEFGVSTIVAALSASHPS
ncbi:MAG TPA: TetR/AcrR family transcriptional regulator [Glaciihabitans sp.]|nr:TetR/AcrR family transcriptional regulator [Glaciihabitans sp.]